jgi:hypothetical protein
VCHVQVQGAPPFLSLFPVAPDPSPNSGAVAAPLFDEVARSELEGRFGGNPLQIVAREEWEERAERHRARSAVS